MDGWMLTREFWALLPLVINNQDAGVCFAFKAEFFILLSYLNATLAVDYSEIRSSSQRWEVQKIRTIRHIGASFCLSGKTFPWSK